MNANQTAALVFGLILALLGGLSLLRTRSRRPMQLPMRAEPTPPDSPLWRVFVWTNLVVLGAGIVLVVISPFTG